MTLTEKLWLDVEKIREQAPIVHNITNHVVMNPTANALLAVGASPVMAHAVEEVEDMVAISRAVVINIGTLSPTWVEAMRLAAKAARKRGIPLVLDPVGAGATAFRTDTAQELLQLAEFSVIRGNASEILALSQAGAAARGVDSQHPSSAAVEAARELARRFGCVVSVSGEIDYITNGEQMYEVHNGNFMLTRVTGMGCSATALTAAFCAVNPDFLQAAAHAMAVMGIAGELAKAKTEGPGTLQIHFLDELHALRAYMLRDRLRMELK